MKSKTLRMLSLAGLSAMAMGLTSCGGKTLTATAYQVDPGFTANLAGYDEETDETTFEAKKYTDGDFIFRSNLTVEKGVITKSVSTEAYTYARWARVSAEVAAANANDVLAVENVYVDATTVGTLYYAKHIRIGDYNFTGTVRKVKGNISYMRRGQYISYRWDGMDQYPEVEKSVTYPLDLDDYLAVVDPGKYQLGERLDWYFTALESGNFGLYGDKEGAIDLQKTYAPNLPSSGILRNNDAAQEAWSKSLAALDAYLAGKKISFLPSYLNEETHKQVVPIKGNSGTWNYNPRLRDKDFSAEGWEPITGCLVSAVSQDSMVKYFTAINNAFGSIEYESYK